MRTQAQIRADRQRERMQQGVQKFVEGMNGMAKALC